jgi:CRP-like cAMP-binding protein
MVQVRTKKYQKKEFIIRSGDRVASSMQVESGIVLIYNAAWSRIVNIMSAGDFIGDTALYPKLPFEFQAVAFTLVVLSSHTPREEKAIIFDLISAFDHSHS